MPRRKLSKETRGRISRAKKGHKVSPETRKKISKKLKGRKLKRPGEYAKVVDTCSVCGQEFEKKSSYQGKKAYCPDCRGSEEYICHVCGDSFKVYKSRVRFTGPPTCCSNECRRIWIRKPWEETSRQGLKLKWIREFGEETLVCNRCGHDKPYNIELHHIVYKQEGGSNDPGNLEPLCLNCHGVEHYENGPDSGERRPPKGK